MKTLIVGQLLKTEKGWYLVPLGRYTSGVGVSDQPNNLTNGRPLLLTPEAGRLLVSRE